MAEDPRVADVRRDLPVLDGVTYLNTGTSGPLPRSVVDAMAESLVDQASQPRIGRAYSELVATTKHAGREAVAAMLGARPSEIALTHNTTEGLNFITLGVNWVRGDEAVTTNVEHPGALLPLWIVKDRYGVAVKTADLLSRPSDPVEAVVRLFTPRTKLVSLSHVSYSTGELLPVAEIAAAARDRGILTLVDGAQSFGALPIDVRALGVDFYSVPGQKWLCGPEGTGALYSAQEAISQIRTTFASYGTVDGYNDYGGMLVKEDGRRFEQGTMHLPDLVGQVAAARWFTGIVGDSWAHERIRELAAATRDRLASVDGVEVITGGRHAGLVSFGVTKADPELVVADLAGRGVLVRSIRSPHAVRMSLGFFNTEAEIADATSALAEVLAETGR
ncbi:MAG: aminotransferase class V-fold PLP-dependent enzyme [Acidimicrobiales bacterium]|nr:aminotransferase class V-fold PLP-dependent enzyme [Acidimicrobiales bacterium]